MRGSPLISVHNNSIPFAFGGGREYQQAMSFSLSLSSFLKSSPPPPISQFINFTLPNPKPLANISSPVPNSKFRRRFPALAIRSVHEESESESDQQLPMPAPVIPEKPSRSRLENVLSTAASLYPLYVSVGGIVACLKPSTFAWFVKSGPASYSLSLGLIMLAMGLTLELKDLLSLFLQRPFVILFGCVAQYTIMPAFGLVVSKCLGLQPSVSVGLILLGCCPGGTASNVVTLIAQGDVPLSIVMTVCTTLGAVVLTPLLTKILAGTYVPVDAVGLSFSTLQVVVAPILLSSYLQSTFPAAVKAVTPFAPLFAVLVSSLLACSVFSENVVRLQSSMAILPLPSNSSLILQIQSILCGEIGLIVLSVLLLHFAGFFVGYISAAVGGLNEPQRRAISIEVGMQNSSLGVVLATSHFTSTMVALPAAMSAVIMNIMGSSLGLIWRYIDPPDSKDTPRLD